MILRLLNLIYYKMELKNKIEKKIFQSNEKIKINTKDIKKNDIFVALQGSKTHGNQYIDLAIKLGAKYCITDKKFNSKKNKDKILVVEDCILFLEKLSKKKRAIYNGKVIGITGSAGKTTLKENLKYYLKKKFKVSASIKSFNNRLGVILSILNLNIKSNYSIFEIGTNNIGEIKQLTALIKPSQMFITNIMSTHLENFKSKKNIAKEKADIFNKKFNNKSNILYFKNTSKEENFICQLAKKQNLKKIVTIGNLKSNCFIEKIEKNNSDYYLKLIVLGKKFLIKLDQFEDHRVLNLLFILSFFIVNKIDTKYIINSRKKFILVDGRGSKHNLNLNGYKVKLIDESYNASPETVIQSIKNFSKIKKNIYSVVILGNMNELGLQTNKLHIEVINELEKHSFNMIILCGNFYKISLKKLSNLKNQYIYKNNNLEIMNYLSNHLHKNAIMLIKCSNKTEVNIFSKKLKQKKE